MANEKQDFLVGQRDLLKQFDEISRKFTQLELDAEATRKKELEKAKKKLEHKKNGLKSLRDLVSRNANLAQDSLSTYFKTVVNKTIASGGIHYSETSAPEGSLKSCADRSEELLNQIKTLSKEPTPLSIAAIIIFVVGLILLWIMTGSFSGGFWLALILTGVSVGGTYSYRNNQRETPYGQLLQLNSDADRWYNASLKVVNEEYEHQVNSIESRYKSSIANARQDFEEKMVNVNEYVKSFRKSIDSLSPAWENEMWNDFVLPTMITWEIRMGELTTGRWAVERPKSQNNGYYDDDYQHQQNQKPVRERIQDYQFSMPLLFHFPSQVGALFWLNGTGKNIAAQQIQSLLLRLLATIPPGKLRFTFIDPVGLGQNVAPFMHLADYDEALVTAKAWSEPKHIEQRLAELTEHIENVIQKYLRNTYVNIEDFNEQAGEVAEPYRFLVVMNFPVNFTEDAARRLVSILQNGPRCGVYSIILYDAEQELPYGFNINDMLPFAVVYYWDGKRLVWEQQDSFKCFFELEQPPVEKIFNSIINKVGSIAVEASKVEVPFEKVLDKSNLPPESWWSGSTDNGIQIPLGPIGANKVQYLDFGKGTAQHALVAGKTGSGKSTLLHVLISTLALKYSPEEVELYLIDFKKGVEFKTYASHQLPHARVIAIESEREFGLSVIEGLDAELKRRGDLFRTTEVDGLKEYRQKVNQRMPRILLLVDEFQEFFTEDDALASKASQILDRLVRQGRAFGIHVLLGSQTLSGAYTLTRSTIDQMAIRIALQCSEADSRLILSDDNPAARLLSRPGEALYNSANGLVEGNSPFQVAWLSDEQQDEYLDKINELAKKQGLFPPKNQIIFEGNAPADAEHEKALNELLMNPQWDKSLKRYAAWLGEPIAIKEPTAAYFRHQSGSNLAIIGQNEEAAIGMFTTGILTLASQHTPQSVKFYFIDFGSVDTSYAELLKTLAEILPHDVHYGRRRQLPTFINEISQELERRIEHEDESLQGEVTIYLAIYGLQRARDLEQDDSFGISLGDSTDAQQTPDPSKQFPKILREGPDFKIHTFIWCDTNTNLNRRLNRQALREFEMKVVFQMSNDDSMSLIDSPLASKLGQHRALFYDEEEGRLEKFRPFALPHTKWLKQIGEMWGRKTK